MGSNKNYRRVPKENKGNWKDHPLAVAATAIAGTLAFVFLVIIPIITAELNNKVEKLISDVQTLRPSYEEEISKLKSQNKFANEEISNLKAQHLDLDKKLFESQNANLFSKNNPYPVGLGQVRIGDSISKIDTVYNSNDILKKDSYWEVKGQHTIFTNIVYSYEEDDRSKTIVSITFGDNYPSKIKNDFLKRKLTEALGSPKEWRKKNYFSWPSTRNVTVYLNTDKELDSLNIGATFTLMDNKFRLGTWPSK